jgi:HEAT repeat protein
VVVALSSVLRNQDRGLRLQALKAILQVAPSGSKDALSAVGVCLHDPHAEVRQAALRVLAQMACRRDCPRGADVQGCEQEALSMLGACLEHQDRLVSQNAREALGHLVPDDGERAVIVAASGLEHGNEQRQNDAWVEIGQLVSRRNPQGLGMLAVLIASPDAKRCKRALQILANSLPTRDERVLASVLAQMKHADVEVRLLALTSAVRHARGHPEAVRAACEMLEDVQADVRQEAAAALMKLAQQDDQQALSSLLPVLQSRREEVRRAALKALPNMVSVGNKRALAAAKVLLEDQDYRVRQEAMKAVNRLAPEGHENLAIVAASAQKAIFAGSSRLMRRQPSSSVFAQVGQQVGRKDSAGESMESQLEWNECKTMALEATAYRTKAAFAEQCKQQELEMSRKRSSRAFHEMLMSTTGETGFRTGTSFCK